MNFNSYLKQRINGTVKTDGKAAFGALTTKSSAAAQLKNISLFENATLDDLKNIDFAKLLKNDTVDAALGKDATSEQKALAEIVKAFLEIEEVQEAADINGNGKLTGKEALEYLESIMENDGKEGSLSLKDIDKEIKSLGVDLEGVVADALKELDKEDEAEEAQKAEEAKAAQQAASSGGSGGVSGGGGVSGSGRSSSASSSSAAAAAQKGESAEDIEKEIQAEESKKSEAKTKMDTEIAEQEKVISETMKDKDSGFPEGFEEEYEKEKAKIDEDIKKQETEIEKQKGIVQDTTSQISALDKSISSLEGQKSTLQAQLSSVSSDSEDAESQRSEINTKINNVTNEIKAKQEEKKKAEEDKKAAEEAQKKAEDEKSKLVTKKDNLMDTMIKEKKLTINQEAQDKIKEAQNKIQEIRTSGENEIKTCDSKIQELKTKLAEVKEKEKTDKVIADNSVYQGNIPKELASALDAKLGAGFCEKLEQIAKKINCDPTDLLGMMNSESGVNPAAVNSNGGATGLIQFMPDTAASLGTSTAALRGMSGVEQLDYVEKFFEANMKMAGIPSGQRLEAGTLYALVFLPALANHEVLTYQGDGHTWYANNSGLDTDRNGDISISDLTVRVQNKYKELYSQYA